MLLRESNFYRASNTFDEIVKLVQQRCCTSPMKVVQIRANNKFYRLAGPVAMIDRLLKRGRCTLSTIRNANSRDMMNAKMKGRPIPRQIEERGPIYYEILEEPNKYLRVQCVDNRPHTVERRQTCQNYS